MTVPAGTVCSGCGRNPFASEVPGGGHVDVPLRSLRGWRKLGARDVIRRGDVLVWSHGEYFSLACGLIGQQVGGRDYVYRKRAKRGKK